MRYILPLLNGIVMALVVIIETFTEFIKQLIGYEEYKPKTDVLQGTNDQLDELIDGMEEANEEAKELEKHLLGIDELNILDPNATLTTDGIDPSILDAFNAALTDWNNKMDEASMKAYQIRDIILSWFGLEQKDDGKWGLVEGESLARTIAETLASIDLSELKDDILGVVETLGKILLLSLALRVLLNPFVLLASGLYLILDGINVELGDGENILEEWEKTLLGISLAVAGAAILFRSWDLAIISLTLFGIYEIAKALNDVIIDGTWNWEDMQKALFGIALVLLAFFFVTKDWILLAMAGIAILGAASLKQLTGFKQRFQEGTTTILDWLALIFMGLLYSIVWVVETVLKLIMTAIYGAFFITAEVFNLIYTLTVGVFDTLAALIVGIINGILWVYNKLTGSNLKIEIDYYSNTKKSFDKMVGLAGGFEAIWSPSLASSIDDAVMDAINSDPVDLANKEKDSSASKSFEDMVKGMGELLSSSEKTTGVIESELEEQKKQTDLLKTETTLLNDISDFYNNMSEGDRKRLLNNTYVLPQGYADGGYPSKGLFLMNEGNSAEMVGSIGGKTAVVNNEQIASALAQALAPMLGSVVTAVENVAANDRPIVLNVDSRQMARANQKGNQKLGYNQIGGEFANV